MPVKRKSFEIESNGEFTSFLKEHNVDLRDGHAHVQSCARFKYQAKAAAGGIDIESFVQGDDDDNLLIYISPLGVINHTAICVFQVTKYSV